MAEPELVLEATALSRRYGSGELAVEVLRGLDLSARAGDFIVILGPSGSGKSTLLNLLGLLDEPSSGEIRLFGQSTRGMSEERRAQMRGKRLGYVFQFDSLLPEFTVLENVMLPGMIAGKRPEARARELLAMLDVATLADRLPARLSGGERQRAALARALINGPAVLLADEPTGNLDRHNGEVVFNKCRELAERLGVAVIMVTHNETASQYASRTVHLSDGAIVMR